MQEQIRRITKISSILYVICNRWSLQKERRVERWRDREIENIERESELGWGFYLLQMWICLGDDFLSGFQWWSRIDFSIRGNHSHMLTPQLHTQRTVHLVAPYYIAIGNIKIFCVSSKSAKTLRREIKEAKWKKRKVGIILIM